MTTMASAVLVGLQDEELGDKPASYRPVLNIDAAGKLRGEFRRFGITGATGPITSTTAVTNNAWHHVVLTAPRPDRRCTWTGRRSARSWARWSISPASTPTWARDTPATAGWAWPPASTASPDRLAGKLRGEFRRAGVTGATGPVTSTQALTDGQWHHVVQGFAARSGPDPLGLGGAMCP
ncbi:hypothetical protein ACFZCL_35500 [Streptomyces sp. NPDC008159]|uniref:hypothetical protein n=1 Tax=Streptomyces sp. NPDC008159 TaxID=3364817 RepID=UPI0036EFA1B4